MPAIGSSRYDGLNAATPQYEAGRITEPPVWVPTVIGSMPAATLAADPADEPPGERVTSCGLCVLLGLRKASSVVTILPSRTPPARRMSATSAASARGWWPR